MNADILQKESLSYLKSIIVGADRLDETLELEFNYFLQKHGCKVVVTKGYGMTEAVAGATYTKSNSNIVGSVGIPLILNNISIFEIEDEKIKECEIGRSGEIAIAGPMVMVGYFGKDAKSDNLVLKKHSDGRIWAHTGNLGHMDQDGRIYVDGRIKRMFTRDGFKIFPTVIESVIDKHPNINESAVIAVNDEVYGNVIKVLLVAKTDSTTGEEKASLWNEVLHLWKEELYEYQMPEQYEFLDKLPLTGMGKVDYRALENWQDANY